MEAVGAVDDHSHRRLSASCRALFTRSRTAAKIPARCLAGLGQGQERLQPAAGGPRAEPVEQVGDLGLLQVAGEDGAQGLLRRASFKV